MKFHSLMVAMALPLLLLGCSTTGPEGGELDPRRGPLGKADTIGSCEMSCGGQSADGNCWCDDQCEFYGDCCDDKTAICDGGSNECGGFLGLTCPEGDYCHYEQDDMCGAADQLGTCKGIPDACIEIFAPVCGCDGVTYSNECFAHAAGTSVVSEGACPDGEEQLCMNDDECGAGESCDTSECHMPPCPDGFACPQVCFGVCTGSEPPEPQECGGFFGLTCPDGLECVDAPNDGCDPQNGGADCGGICVEPAGDSCEGNCGGPAPDGCYCDDLCESYGDCCDDYADACTAEDDREPASGVCVKNSNDECQTDSDCMAGGCGGELCFNPAVSSGISTCECTAPTNVGGCGCVDGQCTWWN